jgi:hypothetical protein
MAQNSRVMAARAGLLALCLSVGATPGAAQSTPVGAGAVFRVFLKSGEALPSYGEAAVAGDRIVFTLMIGAEPPGNSLQLISLPVDRVDPERTMAYANTLRLEHYAATRGAVDYAAMTQEVQRALSEVTAASDPKKRLELAESARKRLMDWSAGTYGYRAAEVRQMADLFDEVITSLRAAAGERQFSLDLRVGPEPRNEPLLPMPTRAEFVRLAIEAAHAADSEDDRVAILQAAANLASASPVDSELGNTLAREVALEKQATAAYAELAASLRARAEAAMKKGDLAAMVDILAALRARDQELGGRRPQMTAALMNELDRDLGRVRAYREALDHYMAIRSTLLAYERNVRPVMSGFDGLTPVFTAVKDDRFTAYERLVKSEQRLATFIEALDLVQAPAELADVHATLMSSLRMASHAIARRRIAAASGSKTAAAEASSAAAGALLLAEQARSQLVARLYPPKIQ